MATPPTSYLPWRRVKDAIASWALQALGFGGEEVAAEGTPVLWADQGEERPDLPYLELLVVGGPTRRGGQDHRRPPAAVLTAQVVQVLPSAVAAAGALLRLGANGELFEREAVLGDTVTDARDDLLALLEESVQPGFTVAASGADAVALAADRLGSLWQVDALIGCALGASTTALAELVVGKRELRIRATVYGAPDADDPGASPAEWIGMLQDAMADRALAEYLRGQGLVLTRVDAVQQRVSAMSGPDRENRAALELTFALVTVRGTALETWLDEAVVTAIDPPPPPAP